MPPPDPPGILYIVATPLGNLEDITLRALRILREAVAVIACEDTRQTAKLLSHFGFHKTLVSYHEHNEQSRVPELLDRLRGSESIALVSDAGTPLLSDPGYRLVAGAIEAGFQVVPIPGPNACITALSASGLATDEFRFIGFLPPQSGARRRALERLIDEPATVILYESPHRILDALGDLVNIMPSRHIVVGRELTKVHEEFLRGTAAEIREQFASRPGRIKGEFTILISGAPETAASDTDPRDEVARLELEGLSRMEAIKTTAKKLGRSKREVYRDCSRPDRS